MNTNKSKGEELKEKLFSNRKNLGTLMDDNEIILADNFCEEYKNFLNKGKTEREAAEYIIKKAQAKGFKPFNREHSFVPGDKVYYVNREKAVILAVIGKKPLDSGVKIIAAHIDSPRLDLKVSPLYEDKELAFFKTHYYGGIKKYQWTALPLSLHGVIIKKDGTKIKINIGEDEKDPVFCITDLLPHLASEQMKKTLADGIKGEDLNILIGSKPFKDDKASELVKLNIANILYEKYGIIEDDFLSAELECVPQIKAADVGFDRSMIGGYGQDDRVCAYAALTSIFDCNIPEHTAVTVLTDKEEVGSDGNTGLNSAYLKNFISDLAFTQKLRTSVVLRNSKCLSADVNAAFDPNFPDVLEAKNSAYINYGIVVTKYTGSRGKAGTSDASAEFMGEVRHLFDEKNIKWQIGELGKVDAGGGGTVAMYIANMDIDVVDVGVPVLSMHSPFEITSKLDIFTAYKAFLEFFKI